MENKIYTGQKNLHGYSRGSRDKYEVWFVFEFIIVQVVRKGRMTSFISKLLDGKNFLGIDVIVPIFIFVFIYVNAYIHKNVYKL